MASITQINNNQIDFIRALPVEVLNHLLPCLTPKDLYSATQVSREWCHAVVTWASNWQHRSISTFTGSLADPKDYRRIYERVQVSFFGFMPSRLKG